MDGSKNIGLLPFKEGAVAQLAECVTFGQGAVGSIPAPGSLLVGPVSV